MDVVEYAPGRRADVYGGAPDPVALLWHGTQTDSRAAVRVLAQALAERGICVVASSACGGTGCSGCSGCSPASFFLRKNWT